MLKEKALTNLLGKNRKVCKLLHDMANIDWENPVSVTEYTGKFTFNSISKEVNRITGKGIEGYTVFLLYWKTEGCFRDRLYLVEVDVSNFNVLKDDIRNGKLISSYYDKVELEYSKGDFEKARKNDTLNYWLIIQSKEMENHRQPVYDESARYKVLDFSSYGLMNKSGSYIQRFEIKPIDSNYECISVSPNGRSNCLSRHVPISERFNIVDKSGYRVGIRRDEYKRKVNAIKLEKSKAEAAVYDNAPKVAEFKARYDKIHGLIIAEMQSEKPNYGKIEKAVRYLDWIGNRFNNFKDNNFTTMTEVNRCIEYIEEYLVKAENEINA